MNETAKIVIVVLFAVLLIANAVQLILAEGQSRRLAALASDFDAYKNKSVKEIDQLKAAGAKLASDYGLLTTAYHSLSAENAQLNTSYISLNRSYSELGGSYASLKNETDALVVKIDDYERNLQDSMQWFRTNSDLKAVNNVREEERIKTNLYGSCFMREGNKCYIKASCFHLVNFNFLQLRYHTDTSTTGRDDRLVSLAEFINNWGGDCEDYSLFYKAEMNYLLWKCNATSSSDIIIESYVTTAAEKQYWLTFNENWFLKYGEAVELKKGYIFPNEVCGNLYDLNTGSVSGHCVIAFTKKRITALSEIVTEFNGAPMIEPQTGEYIGLLNERSSGAYLPSQYGQTPESHVYMIVTDDDLFLFKDDAWTSYSEFSKELEALKGRLNTS